MDCRKVRDQLLAPDASDGDAAYAHLASCPACRAVANEVGEVDRLLRSTLVVEPPPELQLRLAAIAKGSVRAEAATRPQPIASPRSALRLNLSQGLSVAGGILPVLVLASALVFVSWQLLLALIGGAPVVGNIAYAVQLVASSPAALYLSSLQVDVQQLALWVLAAVAVALILPFDAFHRDPPASR